MTKAPLRVAMVGCGVIADYHAAGWAALPEVELVAVVDPDRGAVERLTARHAPRARWHRDLDELLAAEELDLIDILAPPALHPALCARALEARIPTICQKPLADDLRTARATVAAYARAGVPLSVHENHVYRPWLRDLAARLDRGDLGSPLLLRIDQFDARTPPQAANRESRHGVLLQYGIHLVDVALRLLGPPDTVEARTWSANREVRGESHAALRLGYPDTEAWLGAGWARAGLQIGGLTLIGTRGEAGYEGTLTRGAPARWRIARNGETVVDEFRLPDEDYAASFAALQRDMVDSLRTGTSVPQAAARNLATLATTFAAYASAERRRPVALAEFPIDDPGDEQR